MLLEQQQQQSFIGREPSSSASSGGGGRCLRIHFGMDGSCRLQQPSVVPGTDRNNDRDEALSKYKTLTAEARPPQHPTPHLTRI